MRQGNAAGIGLLCVVVFVAAFLKWGAIQAVPDFGSQLPNGMTPPVITFDITGWNGHLNLLGIQLPNWLVVVAALAVGVMSWLRVSGTAEPPSGLAVTLCAYGAAHSAIMNAILLVSRECAVGIGGVLTTLATIGMLVLWLKGTGTAEPRQEMVYDRWTHAAPPPDSIPHPGGNLDALRAEARERAARAVREHADRS